MEHNGSQTDYGSGRKDGCRTNSRPRMDRADRAKQFMPFDALKGLREALAAKERELERISRRELSEEAREELDRRLMQLRPGDYICINFYDLGEYLWVKGNITRINIARREIIVGETRIRVQDIYELLTEGR